MARLPEQLKYAATHEWASLENGVVRVGISDFAQEQLGDVVFVELPKLGRQLKQGEECATIESVKAASGIHSPVSGTVVEINAEVAAAPEKINEQPYDCWLFCIKPDDLAELDGLLDLPGYLSQT